MESHLFLFYFFSFSFFFLLEFDAFGFLTSELEKLTLFGDPNGRDRVLIMIQKRPFFFFFWSFFRILVCIPAHFPFFFFFVGLL